MRELLTTNSCNENGIVFVPVCILYIYVSMYIYIYNLCNVCVYIYTYISFCSNKDLWKIKNAPFFQPL